jgi:hypothetical protein
MAVQIPHLIHPEISASNALMAHTRTSRGDIPRVGVAQVAWDRGVHIMSDDVHMLLNVPTKIALSSVVGYMKGKSAIRIARHFMKRGRNYAGQVFWARGYFVDTLGRDTETIRRYIADQEKEDQRLDQLGMPWIKSQTNANKKN